MKVFQIGNLRVLGYTTGDLSRQLCNSPFTIRRWERNGVLPKPFLRTERGWRVYTSEEVEIIKKTYAKEVKNKWTTTLAETKFTQTITQEFVKIHLLLRKKALQVPGTANVSSVSDIEKLLGIGKGKINAD